MRISDWSSDVCSSDLVRSWNEQQHRGKHRADRGVGSAAGRMVPRAACRFSEVASRSGRTLFEDWGTTAIRPKPGFSTRRYLRANPDVAAAGMNPLVHYLRVGRGERTEARRVGKRGGRTCRYQV